jgi:LysR family transcriptional regulator for metE and metH
MADDGRQLRDATLRQLRALAAVAESGSYTAAAGEIGVTQPAISLQIQTLQDRIGLPLFERANGRLIATEAGAMLAATSHEIEEILTETGRQLAAMRAGQGGQVAIGAVSTAKYFVPFAISAFQQAHPDIEIRLVIGNREEIIGLVRSNKLDIAIIGRPPDDIVLESQKLGDHPHVIICAPQHRLAARARVALADLADATFLVREPGSGTRTLMERHFAEHGLCARIGMEIASNETIKQAVMAGLGIAFISAHVIAAEVADRRLAIVPVEGLPLLREWFVIRRPERALLPAAARMYGFLAGQGSRHLPELPIPVRQRSRQRQTSGRIRLLR